MESSRHSPSPPPAPLPSAPLGRGQGASGCPASSATVRAMSRRLHNVLFELPWKGRWLPQPRQAEADPVEPVRLMPCSLWTLPLARLLVLQSQRDIEASGVPFLFPDRHTERGSRTATRAAMS